MVSKITVGAVVRFAGLVGVATAVGVNVAAADFVLKCHGGGQMTFDVRTIGAKVRLEVVMGHAPSTTPGPGQCSFIDRPVNGNEPTRLHISEGGELQVFCNARGQCGVGLVPPDIRVITDAITRGRDFFVHVHNNNSGFFEISHVGP